MKFKLPSAGPIIVPAVLIGPKTTQRTDFIIDTGAEYCSIPIHLAQLLGYDIPRQCRMVTLVTANGIVKTPSVLLNEIRVGNAYARLVAATCHEIGEIPEALGFLGLNFLRRCRTVIDYQTHTLNLHRFR